VREDCMGERDMAFVGNRFHYEIIEGVGLRSTSAA